MRKQLLDHMGLVIVLGIILTFKVASLALYGPIHMPDSGGYALFADHMLADNTWFFVEDLEPDTSSTRIIGYPLFLALMKIISPTTWDWHAAIVQSVLSFFATIYVYRLSLRLTAGLYLALFTTFAHGVGQAFMLDQCILTDSLNASFLIILSCHISLGVLDDRRPSYIQVACLGCLVLAAFLMREGGFYLQVFFWPLIAYWALHTMGINIRVIVMVFLFALPMLLGVEAYKSWNQMRSGERFITTGASTAMYFPSVYLEHRGVEVFAHDPLLNDMKPLPQFAGMVRIVRTTVQQHLIDEHGFNMLDIARYGHSLFYNNWRKHPWEMLTLTASHLEKRQMQLPFIPIGTLDRTVLWAAQTSAFPAPGQLWRNLVNDLRVDQALMVAGRMVERVIATLITLAFVLGSPILLVREIIREHLALNRYDPVIALTALYWLMYSGYTLVYAMVSFEVRYLMPVVPLSLIAGTMILVVLAKTLFPKLVGSART